MWIHTDDSFMSIVAHNARPDDLLLRARTRLDLENFGVPDDAIWCDVDADYYWRAIMPREWVGKALMDHSMKMQYHDVKNSVKKNLGSERADTLLSVWYTMHAIADEEPIEVKEADYERRGEVMPQVDRWMLM